MGVCNCSMFCFTLLYVHSSIAIILMGKRELIALLNLSSWCLVMVEGLFLAVQRDCLQFVVFPDFTHLLFWKIVNKERKSTSKSVVQPICREDGSLAVSDEEIFIELKKRYGKESLDVKDYVKDWYESVENDVLLKAREHEEVISKSDFKDMSGHKNSDLYIEEIEAAISSLNNNSAPKIVSEYDQEIPQSQIADNPVAPRGRAAQPSRDTRKTN